MTYLNIACNSEPLADSEIDISKQKSTYVMQGSALEKRLDVYHLILAPSNACNLRCRHCYLPDHHNELLPKDVALRLMEEWNEIVLEERGRYGGIFHVKGGEPFVVPYLWDLIEQAKKLRSLRFMITTNGTFTGEIVADKLQDCNEELEGNLTLVVSLDGATEETHAILRGQGNFSKTIKFMEGLRKRGIRFYLNCVLHNGNIGELSAYVELAKKCGASQINFLSFVPKGQGTAFKEFQRPHLEVYQKLSEIYKHSDDEAKRLLTGSLPQIKCAELCSHSKTSHECVAGYRGMFYITSDGSVFTCPNIVQPEFSLGNVIYNGLRLISENRGILSDNIQPYNNAYTCAGEELLYMRATDLTNKASLKRLRFSLQTNLINIVSSEASKPLISYCYSKNW